jgi:hypothetical protein
LEALLDQEGFSVRRRSTLSVEYDWFGTLQSWMNRLSGDDNSLYYLLQGRPSQSAAREVLRLILAMVLALPALASALWDALRGRGGTLTVVAQKR